jgi:hypothetical protein
MTQRELKPGTYAYDFDAVTERPGWEAWLHANAATVVLLKTWQDEKWVAVLFTVSRNTVWPLAGWPMKPKKGIKTDLNELMREEDASPSLVELGKKLADALSSAGKSVSNAATLVLWAGAAILLFNLFRATKPAED